MRPVIPDIARQLPERRLTRIRAARHGKRRLECMTRLLAITGTYRDDGMIDNAVATAVETARRAGADVEVVNLRDYPIEFCKNCRECMQSPGETPGACVQRDRMDELIHKIEAADRFVLASPTNFFSVTALFKRFMERLAVYAYWPWGQPAPKPRKKGAPKKALVIASCAAPAVVGRVFFSTVKELKMAAKTFGAAPSSVLIGLASQSRYPVLKPADARRIERATERLLAG